MYFLKIKIMNDKKIKRLDLASVFGAGKPEPPDNMPPAVQLLRNGKFAKGHITVITDSKNVMPIQ